MEFDFALILMGHLVGDYLLQSKEMALRKTELGLKGFAWCFLHSMVYALTVCVFLWSFDGWVLALVFMTHFPLDRGLWLLSGSGSSADGISLRPSSRKINFVKSISHFLVWFMRWRTIRCIWCLCIIC